MAGTSVGEFLINLVVDAGKGELTISNLVASMGQLEVASVGEVAILFELAQRLAAITDGAIKTAMSIVQVSAATGMSTKSLQQWQSAGEYFNITSDEVSMAMESVSSQIYRLQHGEESTALLNLNRQLTDIGINFKELNASKPEEIYERISGNKTFRNMSKPGQADVMKNIGQPRMLRLMQEDPDERHRRMTDAAVESDREIAKYTRVHDQLVHIEEITKKIKLVIADWFSEAVLRGLIKVGDVFNLELESLKEIRAFFDKGFSLKDLNKTEAIKMIGSGLLESAKLSTSMYTLPFDYLMKKFVVRPEVFSPFSSKESSQYIRPVPLSQTIKNEINILGTKLSTAQLTAAIQDGITRAMQPAVAQLDIGYIA